MHLNSHIEKVVEKDDPGWQNTDSLVVVKYSRNQASYEDPTYVFPSNYFPYRSTLVKDSEGNWKVLEISKRYAQEREPFEDFEKETETIQHCLQEAFHFVSLVFQFPHKNVQIKKEEQVITGALRMVVKNWFVTTVHLVQQGFLQQQ